MKEMEAFWTGLGIALVILSIFIGIGGCVYLFDKGEAARLSAGSNSK